MVWSKAHRLVGRLKLEMKRFFDFSALVAILMWAAMTQAQAATGEACEKEWRDHTAQFLSREHPDFKGLLSYWQQRAADCAGTGAYEARLATVYLYLGDQKKARAQLVQARTHGSQYVPLIDLVELTADSFALTDHRSPTDAELKQIGKRAVEFADRYPDYVEGLTYAGGVLTTVGEHAKAIPLLEKAFVLGDKKMPRAGLFRNATISYAAVGNYKQAFHAAGAAIDDNETLTAEPVFMYALIKSEMELGMLEDAKMSAQLLAGKNPTVKADPEFVQLVGKLNQRLATTGDARAPDANK
jgi:tetratricopeptide (TPR) repeat protein